ncbi:MAG: hypothetical protein ABEJ40_02490 [Haloarculaceae archaeon]
MVETDPSFMQVLCRRRRGIQLVFALSALIFVLHVPYPFVADPNTGTYVVALLNLVGTGFFMLVSGLTLKKCREYT